MKWNNMHDKKPADDQDCLTKMKHGLIQGSYRESDGTFGAYYWRDMEWYATGWIPIEEVLGED